MSFQPIKIWFDTLPSNVKGGVFLMFAAAGFSLMIALIKLAGQNLHIMQILFVRQSVMAAIVLPSIAMNFPGSLRTERLGLQLLRIVFALTAMSLGFTAVIQMPLAEVTTIGFAKSFFLTIFAMVILHEVIGIRRWAAVFIGFAGVLLVMRPGLEGFTIYSLYALIAAACAAVVMVLIRILSQTESTITILTYQAIGVGAAVAIPGLYFWQWPSMTEWLLLVAMGIVSYIAQSLNISAYRHGEASVMASLDYARLIFTIAFGFLIFSEVPDSLTLIGAGVIISASIYTIHREAKRKQVLMRQAEGRGTMP